MGIVDIDVQKPGLSGVVLANEIDGAIGSPCGLMKLRGDSVFRFSHGVEVATFFPYPVCVGVGALGPVVTGSVRMLPISESVVQSGLGALARTDEMEFPNHATAVSGICDQLRNEGNVFWESVIPVACVASTAGVKACHETRAARRADRALAVGVSERDSRAYETIDGGSLDMRIAEGADGIKSLLIGAVPEDVGARHNFLGTGFCR